MKNIHEESYGFIELFFKNEFVNTTLLNKVCHQSKNHPLLYREEFGGKGLKDIDTDASENAYKHEFHVIYLNPIRGRVNKGVLAEELQHALDRSDKGIYYCDVEGWEKLRKECKKECKKKRLNFLTIANAEWHQRVFKRIASTLEGNEYNNSIFKLFLEPKHAKNFLSATEELKRRTDEIKRSK